MQSSFVPVEGQAEAVEARRQHPRRAFLLTLAVVLTFSGLLYFLAARMNYVPLPAKLRPYAIPNDSYLDPTGMLSTRFYIDGLPNKEVIDTVTSYYRGKKIEAADLLTTPYSAAAAPPDIRVICGSPGTCTLEFYRQLSAPEQLYEKGKRFVGL